MQAACDRGSNAAKRDAPPGNLGPPQAPAWGSGRQPRLSLEEQRSPGGRLVGTPTVSVVVPVYNSASTVARLVSDVGAVLDRTGGTYEIILVNDGSEDDSWETITKMVAAHDMVRGVDLTRNYGQHNALLCGVREARYEVIVTIDDDLQHPPEEIPRLVAALEQGHDLIYGVPEQEQHGLWRPLASKLVKLMLRTTMGATAAEKVSAFRVFRRPLREAFRSYRGPFVSLDVLLGWATVRVGAVRVRHDTRLTGDSQYGVRRLLTHAANLVTGMSVLPWQLATVIGLVFSLFGVGVLVFVLGRYLLQGGSVAGFPFLASIIAVFAGAQLFALGIIGAYLARIHFHVMQRPAYAVRRRTPPSIPRDPA